MLNSKKIEAYLAAAQAGKGTDLSSGELSELAEAAWVAVLFGEIRARLHKLLTRLNTDPPRSRMVWMETDLQIHLSDCYQPWAHWSASVRDAWSGEAIQIQPEDWVFETEGETELAALQALNEELKKL
jgi:hypothetical protein